MLGSYNISGLLLLLEIGRSAEIGCCINIVGVERGGSGAICFSGMAFKIVSSGRCTDEDDPWWFDCLKSRVGCDLLSSCR